MKLGAQFYTIRTETQTPEALDNAFARIQAIGYENVQLSAIGPIPAETIKSISEKYALPVVCTHISFDRIVNDTEAVIAEHKLYGCPCIGLGSMPNEYRGSREAAYAFVERVKEPIRKIEAAGLSFAYHNHSFEFNNEGGDIYDILIEELPTMQFILDTFWLVISDRDPVEYIKRLGPSRLQNVHFKDMRVSHKGMVFDENHKQGDLICPCGEGIIDFAPIVKICDTLGIPNALVEQDNAPALGDVFEQMKTSFDNLKPLF